MGALALHHSQDIAAGSDGTARATPPSPARQALAQGNFDAVRHFAARMMMEDPHNGEGHFLFGLAESHIGRIGAGIAHLHDAVQLDASGEYRAQLARLQIMARRDGEAAATLREAEDRPPADALSRDTIGCVYARLGDHKRALPHFEVAARLAPHDVSYRYNLATTLNFLGRTVDAEAALEALLDIAPDDARAHHLLSALRKQTRDDNHIDRLTTRLARTTDGRGRLLLGYALAKELEDIGEPDDAFARLCAVNAEHRHALPYSFDRDAALFDAVEAAWPLAPARGGAHDQPIFIVGMPRTGTTLVDRILSSHPLVESAGELQAMPLAVKKAAGTQTPMVMDAQTIAAAASADLGAVGRDYLDRAAPHRRDRGLRFIDKFPGNFFYAGFIAQSLPGARIICLRRNPMDTILSNFRNLFAVGSRYYDYSYDLLDIADYYVRFDRLMRLWRERLGDRLIEIGYEDLVADQEGQSRRLLAHIGLDWSEDCLSFHANRAPVSTPSAAQVRRPIYADSVGRWKRHAALLGPARRVFEQSGIDIE